MGVGGSPKVSVVVCTYNHEPFIDQALASVLGQNTSFEFEVIVSEDRSSDATRDIVLRWRDEHPDRIRLLLSERNLRSNEVVARGFRAAAGEYVALLDGDDYWTSAQKLQRQADFLDEHPECTLCFHDAEVVDDAGRSIAGRRWTPANQKTISTLEDIWFGNFMTTCSTMFRKAALPSLPAWYSSFVPMLTDWPLYILHAEHGDIGYIPEVMCAYRQHAGGLYSQLATAEKLRSTDRFYKRMNECTAYRHDATVRRAHRRYFLDWAHEHLARGEPALARLCVRLSLGYGMPRRASELAETLRVGLAAHTRRRRPHAAGEAGARR